MKPRRSSFPSPHLLITPPTNEDNHAAQLQEDTAHPGKIIHWVGEPQCLIWQTQFESLPLVFGERVCQTGSRDTRGAVCPEVLCALAAVPCLIPETINRKLNYSREVAAGTTQRSKEIPKAPAL